MIVFRYCGDPFEKDMIYASVNFQPVSSSLSDKVTKASPVIGIASVV